ncbi:hypothetical protein Pyn_16108 [Prunus yedoensis var. nudiflora]|uniref:EXS domain-containing protein n=1 Tax=Prunus yedoensis var. nudiflora TaxID=2094558 RepID=A0A314YFS8_PRUYE|nr:hypothetical protein Pyn_16108 [Prunus yedoensis var. nudiflora]
MVGETTNSDETLANHKMSSTLSLSSLLVFRIGLVSFRYTAHPFFSCKCPPKLHYQPARHLEMFSVPFSCSAPRLVEEKDPMQAIYVTYWDLVVDWGLLQRNSKNRWLRDKLLIPYKSVYFGAMTSHDCGCGQLGDNPSWDMEFFRLENEHLNNVGKYRAFKSVPLPFNYDEDQGKHE